MSVLDENEILEEITVEIRNSDVLSTTQRNVTTTTDTGIVNGTSIVIGQSNVKNIRYITVDSTTLNFGADYLVDYETSTVTFNASQSGTYNANYDYGTDAIFPDYPRSDLTISDFPRIGMGIIDVSTESGGFGNVNKNRVDVSLVVYGPNKNLVRGYVKSLRTWIIQNQNSLYYMKLIKPVLQGPLNVGDFNKVKDKIFVKNIDLAGLLIYEVN